MFQSKRSRQTLEQILSYTALCTFAFFALAPFYWMTITSFRSQRELYRVVSLWPKEFYFGHWVEALTSAGVPIWMKNSFTVASSTMLLSIAIGVPSGYAISRLRFRGRNLLALSLIFVYLVPSYLLFIPYFAVLVRLDLTNNLLGLAITHLSFTVPFCTWLLVGYFKTIPSELEDAALVDGCNRLTTLLRITLPLAAPAIVVTALFSFTLSWNEFLYSIVFLTNRDKLTITAGLLRLMTEDEFPWGLLMTASVLSSIVPVVLYFISQRWVIRGLVVGAVKG